MLISVIVPVYNVAAYLRKCVESVLEQSYRDFELILVDDGSVDGSGEICDAYAAQDVRVKVIHQKNGGVSSARNAGIRAAQGQYLHFVDADDYLALDYFAAAAQILQERRPGVLLNNYLRITDAGECSDKFADVGERVLTQEEALYEIISGQYVGWEPFASFYEAKGSNRQQFPEDICYGEDLLFKYNVLKGCEKSIIYAPLKRYYYLVRAGSATTGYDVARKADDLKVMEIIMADGGRAADLLFIKEYLPRLVTYRTQFLRSGKITDREEAKKIRRKLCAVMMRALKKSEVSCFLKIKLCAAALPDALLIPIYFVFKRCKNKY